MPRRKTDVLKYLADTRAHYTVYHNHKEVSAWAGVVLYVIFATQIAFARDDMFKSEAVVYAAWALRGVWLVGLVGVVSWGQVLDLALRHRCVVDA